MKASPVGSPPAVPGRPSTSDKYLGDVFRRLTRQRECEIEEGHLMVDPLHRMISIPAKHSVARVVGYITGKSAIYIARHFRETRRNFAGSTSGREATSCPRWAR